MAKTKRKNNKETPIDSFKYKGTVNVKIVKGKTVLSTQTFHNTGYIKLFEFICNALAGNYDSSNRPCKLVLYTGVSTEPISNPNLENKQIVTLSPIFINTSPVVTKDTQKNNFNVSYHFTVPYAFISGSNTEIYKAGLMRDRCNTEYSKFEEELCASYLFTETDPTTKVESWSPILIEKTSGNLSLIIEWTMSIQN